MILGERCVICSFFALNIVRFMRFLGCGVDE